MFFTHDNVVYTRLSGKRKFICLICYEKIIADVAYIGHHFGQYAGYACKSCCELPKPAIAEPIKVHKEDLLYSEPFDECVRVLAKYSRRSSFATQIILEIEDMRRDLVDSKISTDICIDKAILREIERCIADGLVKPKKKNAFVRNILGLLKTTIAVDEFIEIMGF